jgi:hypothetical protein
MKLYTKILIHLLVISLFAMGYLYIAKYVGSGKDRRNFDSFETALYYSTITHFTIGFGDVAPDSKEMKRLTMCQALGAFSLMAL